MVIRKADRILDSNHNKSRLTNTESAKIRTCSDFGRSIIVRFEKCRFSDDDRKPNDPTWETKLDRFLEKFNDPLYNQNNQA